MSLADGSTTLTSVNSNIDMDSESESGRLTLDHFRAVLEGENSTRHGRESGKPAKVRRFLRVMSRPPKMTLFLSSQPCLEEQRSANGFRGKDREYTDIARTVSMEVLLRIFVRYAL